MSNKEQNIDINKNSQQSSNKKWIVKAICLMLICFTIFATVIVVKNRMNKPSNTENYNQSIKQTEETITSSFATQKNNPITNYSTDKNNPCVTNDSTEKDSCKEHQSKPQSQTSATKTAKQFKQTISTTDSSIKETTVNKSEHKTNDETVTGTTKYELTTSNIKSKCHEEELKKELEFAISALPEEERNKINRESSIIKGPYGGFYGDTTGQEFMIALLYTEEHNYEVIYTADLKKICEVKKAT